jgi:NADH-quinone oxidoreductase subunit E
MDIIRIESVLSKFPQPKGNLIAILHEMQNEYNYLPEEELRYVSKKTGVALSQIYSIATFYNRFSLQPKGEHQVCVCLGTACHVKGAQKVMDSLERSLNIREGETTDDLKFSLGAVRCIGACSLAPAVVIDDETYREMTPKKITKALKRYR